MPDAVVDRASPEDAARAAAVYRRIAAVLDAGCLTPEERRDAVRFLRKLDATLTELEVLAGRLEQRLTTKTQEPS